ncbi:uncharacterized protein VTP21DRAFT_3309 [Calcarisporiella thermophila]|uniref:uncharacterized protein n=1 Tax=Calcarisporiella thermophila TaxID=911321 RepID=UPI0037443DD8
MYISAKCGHYLDTPRTPPPLYSLQTEMIRRAQMRQQVQCPSNPQLNTCSSPLALPSSPIRLPALSTLGLASDRRWSVEPRRDPFFVAFAEFCSIELQRALKVLPEGGECGERDSQSSERDQEEQTLISEDFVAEVEASRPEELQRKRRSPSSEPSERMKRRRVPKIGSCSACSASLRNSPVARPGWDGHNSRLCNSCGIAFQHTRTVCKNKHVARRKEHKLMVAAMERREDSILRCYHCDSPCITYS